MARATAADKAAIAAPALVWETTDSLLKVMNPENPRDHFEEDITSIALSLLKAGWVEYGICRQRNGMMIGGHGRVQAAHWLSEQAPEWFEHAWQKWLKGEGRSAIASEHQERFTAGYWQRCPVNLVNLDPITQKAAMIRLNNQNQDGQNNNSRLAALLVQMPKDAIEQSGYTQSEANSFAAAFAERKASVALTEAEQTEFEGKQHFQRPDATDYSGSGDGSPNDATGESGDVSSNFDEDNFYEDGDRDESDTDDTSIRMAHVDSHVDTFRANVFDHTKEYSETRAVLYVSHVELNEYKALVNHAAAALNVTTEGVIAKLWRTHAVLEALRTVKALYPDVPQFVNVDAGAEGEDDD